MPGIVGLISCRPREEAEQELRQMVQALSHEDFYVAGTWVDEALGVYVGWVARKGSFSDGMPLRNERRDTALVFSGEEFPEPGTPQRLKERGHELELGGASYLVHLYEEDASFPSGLNGRFQGLVIDRKSGTAVLFNDRYGMHRIYFHESKEAFYFAAEAKAILTVRPELRSLDPLGLGEFVACGCTLDGRSLFEGIQVLPAGSKWIFRNGAIAERGKFFEPREWEKQERLETEPYYGELRNVFSGNLPRYFRSQENIGISLTGGLDTRMILAWQKLEADSTPCYTFGGMFRDCQDVIVARKIATLCGQKHKVIPVGGEFLARFSHYAERTVYLSDGYVDVGVCPDLYLNERARESAPVRMTGLYGSEVLRGVCAFKPEQPLPGLFAPEFLHYTRQASDTYARLFSGHPLTFAVFKQAANYHFGLLSLEQTQNSVRTPYLDNDLVRTVFRAPESSFTDSVSLRLIADGNRELLAVPTDRGLGGNSGRFSEAASHAFLEFLFKAEYGYDMGMPQWVARADHALSALQLERLFLGRHKIFHFRVWYRDALAGYVQEILLDPRTLARPFFDRKGLEAMVRGHLKGNRNYTTQIHKALTLELLHRLFLDPGSTIGSMGKAQEKLEFVRSIQQG
jgi:asparagine synthase (glutamine-hydrolysing)